jgi:hypothetical protein
MAVEQYANNPVTTLDGAIDNAVTTVVVANGSVFPSTGEFRLVVDDEIMLVTNRVTDTLTVTRGVEGTAAASHLDLALARCSMTKQSLLNLTRDGYKLDTFANRPSAGREGRVFIPSDNPVIGYYDTGSAWKLFEHGPMFTAPTLATLGTWVNQQAATYTQVDGFLRLEDDGTTSSGEDWRLVVKTMSPGATAEIITACRFHTANLAPQVFAHVYRNSSNDDFTTLGVITRANQYNLSAFGYTWTDPNTAGVSLGETTSHIEPRMFFLKSKFTVATGGYELWISHDMKVWKKIRNGTGATAGVNQCGIGINNITTGAIDQSLTVDIFHLEINET